jgi:hypothetical protein
MHRQAMGALRGLEVELHYSHATPVLDLPLLVRHSKNLQRAGGDQSRSMTRSLKLQICGGLDADQGCAGSFAVRACNA